MKPTYKLRDGVWVWSSGIELELDVIEQPDNEEEAMENGLDKLAELIDKLENLRAALEMPGIDQIHISQMKTNLPEIRQELLIAYVSLGGEDHWKHNPPNVWEDGKE